jgi:2-amino-4-hydroxy-6-hydroxymethyldihydropteridine diphosphokinase
MANNDDVLARGRWLVGLGGNVGGFEEIVERFRAAAFRLEIWMGGHGRITAVSSLYLSEPWGGVSKERFVNGALELELDGFYSARALLRQCKGIEEVLGRIPRERWGPRELDLDLLFWKGGEVATKELMVPHLRAREREFVLQPAVECGWGCVPVSGSSRAWKERAGDAASEKSLTIEESLHILQKALGGGHRARPTLKFFADSAWL